MTESAGGYSRSYTGYALGLLLLINAFNYIDRLALGVVLDDIKADLSLTDTQLGLLTGIAFALFYSVMGIPIARWADRGNRVTVIAVTTTIWSITVALCGFAATFVQLMLIRIFVAVGEAGCLPPAYSLISDYFSREKRARATAIYGMGASFASILGFSLAGWLSELYGWRIMFMILGAPGLLLALLVWFTLREPRLSQSNLSQSTTAGPQQTLPLATVLGALWANITFRNLLLSWSVLYFFLYGILQWQPTFFARSYGLSNTEVGAGLGVAIGVSGLIGTLVGGELASRLAPANEARQLRGCAVAVAMSGVLSTFVYLSTSALAGFAFIAASNFMIAMISGPSLSVLQTAVSPRTRAMAFATLFLVANLIGMGFGPLTTGMMSDAFRPHFGDESLRYALLVLAPGYLWAAWYLWVAAKHAARDIGLEIAASSEAPTGGLA